MVGLSSQQWSILKRWSAVGFGIQGLGMGVSFVIVGLRDALSFTLPEWVLAVVGIPTTAILFLVGLLGYYPHLSEAAPRIALAGAVTSAIGGLAIIGATVGGLILQLTTGTSFTQGEENPVLLALFFLFIGMYFLSFLLYGIGSTWTGYPSRSIGVLFLVVVVEPGSVLLFDVVGINLGQYGGAITLGIAALAMLGIAYLLRSEQASAPRTSGISA